MKLKVKYENFNGRKIEDYYIDLKRFTDKILKTAKSADELYEELKGDIMYYYWCKCEWELCIEQKDGRLMLVTLFDDNIRIDVTDDEDFDWLGFYKEFGQKKLGGKFDVYDQLMYDDRLKKASLEIWNSKT